MSPKGRALIVGGPALVNEVTPSLIAHGYEIAIAADVREAAKKISADLFAVVVVDIAKTASEGREELVKLKRERSGFALFFLEAAPPLSPTASAALRRLSWPLPSGFLDQIRATEVPVLLFVEPTLFLTLGIQNALRRAGVQFFQIEGFVGVVEMMRKQMTLADIPRPKPAKTGFWEKISGASKEQDVPVTLGHVAVVKFDGSAAEAAQFDERARQALPNAVTYLVATSDPVRAAVLAVASGEPALLPRASAARLAEVLEQGLSAAKSVPRGKERVLLVDNDMPTLSRLTEALMALGYDVTSTTSGEEALKLAELKPFGLAAIGGSALETKKLSGSNLALKAREKDKDLRLILMVDQFPVQDALKGVSRAIELGLDDAILKPVDASRLVLSIQRALEQRFLKLENERLLKEVQESARKLAQVNGFQTKFFATVAHDVKNPLTAILGYSEVLSMRLAGRPEELKCVEHVYNAARTLNLLISDLVDLAAIESGKLRVEIGDLNLAAVIDEVKSRVDVVAQNKKLKFGVKLPSQFPALRGDAHRIGQVIQNLCTNAVQYTKAGGQIAIEVVVQPDWVVVGVRDTGIGISKEDLPRVWERFFQSQQAQTMRKAGFGLGLKIAREIVQMHGGDMGIESELGVGSFFFFRLPIPKPSDSAMKNPSL